MNRQWKGNTGGGTFGQLALIRLSNVLGLKPLYAVLIFVVPFYMLFARSGYLAVYHYFKKQFCFSAWKAFCWTYKNHFRFGQVILDKFAVFAGRNPFEVEIVGNEYFKRLSEGEKGFVIVGSHVGNFEIGGYLLHSDKKRFNAVVYSGETETVQQNRSKLLNSTNITLMPVNSDMSHLFAANIALQNGEIVSMFADRMFGSAKSVECQFLSGRASFHVGAFALAKSADVDVLAIFCVKTSAKKYKIFISPLCMEELPPKTKRGQISNLVQNYVSELEQILKQYPEQWFNFYEFWK
jgi:predicted LPLAT superfamily acyltransferase